MGLNPELKAKWIEALRSGEYTQGRGTYITQNSDGSQPSFCAMGLLYFRLKGIDYAQDGDWLIPRRQAERLIDMNDKEGKSFAEIADYIEANL